MRPMPPLQIGPLGEEAPCKNQRPSRQTGGLCTDGNALDRQEAPQEDRRPLVQIGGHLGKEEAPFTNWRPTRTRGGPLYRQETLCTIWRLSREEAPSVQIKGPLRRRDIPYYSSEYLQEVREREVLRTRPCAFLFCKAPPQKHKYTTDNISWVVTTKLTRISHLLPPKLSSHSSKSSPSLLILL